MEIFSFFIGMISVIIGFFIYINWKWSKFYKKIKLEDGTIIYIWKSMLKNKDGYSISIEGLNQPNRNYIEVKNGRIISANINA